MSLYGIVRESFHWGRDRSSRCNSSMLILEGKYPKYRREYSSVDVNWVYTPIHLKPLEVKERL